ARDGEEALLIPHLSVSIAGGAVDGRLPGSCAASPAVLALFHAPHLYLLADAEDGFLKFEGQVFAQVGATLRARAASASLLAEHVTKKVAEDVLEIYRGFESAEAAWAAGHSGMTEAVIAR